ncbi:MULTISPECIES: DUF6352 family protein [Bradyrhizobium]|uniref:Uncharacterized protein n=2 Tax=Bradyrhizobium TaxID=374 RepID=A0ABY0P8K0_9BRAD|nr:MULTISPECIES: DUF6352 family protein [Bradyrhizobium]SDH65380.1 hypothetical protein SAMN05444163_0651 [Bradyrhizobium ottawaense]SEE17309.1 hypothetical protein SAMN05444171_6516 [Bradyrhizobium lablabi]SHM13339.1 hypothetical protein SAMN05444321_5318 [Bradyrhizobium lablabi]
MSATRDFWLSCGHHLLDRDATGKLLVTDEFLKAYLARPELMPPPDACAAERSLHAALLIDPRQAVAAPRVAAIADADARDNWEMMIAWRDQLVKHQTLEAAYLEIIRRNIKIPHVLMAHLVQAILRNLLNDCDDAFMLRAAEMFFRPQKLLVQEGSITAIDEETGAALARHPPSPLLALLGLPATAEVDLLGDATAARYWEPSDRFDMALDLTAGRRGRAALGEVITRWLAHLFAIDVAIEPVAELQAAPWIWYVGLSADATHIGDTIWNDGSLDEAMRARLVGLYRLTFRDPADMIEKVRGEPVYLLAAMTPDEKLWLKPQNLVTGPPVQCGEAVH